MLTFVPEKEVGRQVNKTFFSDNYSLKAHSTCVTVSSLKKVQREMHIPILQLITGTLALDGFLAKVCLLELIYFLASFYDLVDQ